jgi:Spy/CpxP family protein refolding chaperone
MKILTAICVLCVLLISPSFAQNAPSQTPSNTDIQLARSDVQAAKNEIIAHTMQFTDAESKAFWPIYRDYANDQQKIGDKRVQLIKQYAQDYDTMDDATANDMVKRQEKIEEQTLNLRNEYWKKFEKALGAKQAAKFYQVDNRLSLMINYQLASAIPLIP